MKVNEKRELIIETQNRMKEMEQMGNCRIKKPLSEDRIKNLIEIYDDEVKWLIEVDSFSSKKRKELGYENKKEIEIKLNECKMVVIVLHQLINTPSYLIPYSKENGEYSFCEYLIELYSKEN